MCSADPQRPRERRWFGLQRETRVRRKRRPRGRSGRQRESRVRHKRRPRRRFRTWQRPLPAGQAKSQRRLPCPRPRTGRHRKRKSTTRKTGLLLLRRTGSKRDPRRGSRVGPTPRELGPKPSWTADGVGQPPGWRKRWWWWLRRLQRTRSGRVQVFAAGFWVLERRRTPAELEWTRWKG